MPGAPPRSRRNGLHPLGAVLREKPAESVGVVYAHHRIGQRGRHRHFGLGAFHHIQVRHSVIIGRFEALIVYCSVICLQREGAGVPRGNSSTEPHEWEYDPSVLVSLRLSSETSGTFDACEARDCGTASVTEPSTPTRRTIRPCPSPSPEGSSEAQPPSAIRTNRPEMYNSCLIRIIGLSIS